MDSFEPSKPPVSGMPKLTKRAVDALLAEGRETIHWDSELPGFGLRVQASGHKSFLVQYRNANGRTRRLSLGRYGALTPDQARRQAQQTLAAVAAGNDPSATRQAARAAPTMDDLLERYLREHVERHNAATTQVTVADIVKRHIRPALGGMKVAALTRQDVIRLHNALAPTPRQANNMLSILSKACALAETWELRPEGSNPCRRVKRFAEVQRERFLSAEEMVRLGNAIREAEDIGLPWAIDPGKPPSKHLAKVGNRRTPIEATALDAVRLLLLTGARLSEVLTLRWEHVDFERGEVSLPGRKGGKRRPHPFSTVALALLAGRSAARTAPSPWVLPRIGDPGRCLAKSVIENAWGRLRHHAGLDDVRLHDLRHTVGTYASQSGVNAFIVRDLLRHKTTVVTELLELRRRPGARCFRCGGRPHHGGPRRRYRGRQGGSASQDGRAGAGLDERSAL